MVFLRTDYCIKQSKYNNLRVLQRVNQHANRTTKGDSDLLHRKFFLRTNLNSFSRRLRMPYCNHLVADNDVMFCVSVVEFDGKSVASSHQRRTLRFHLKRKQ